MMQRRAVNEVPEPEYTGPRRIDWRPPEEGTGVVLPSGQVIGGTGGDSLGDLIGQIAKHFGGPFGLGGGDLGTHTPGSGLPGPSDIGKVIDHISKHYFGGNIPISSNPGGTLGKGDPAAILGEMFGHLHDLPGFDPTGGYRHPSHHLPDVHAHMEKQRREVMKWLGSLGHGYDPNRADPRRGMPPGRWEHDDPDGGVDAGGDGGTSSQGPGPNPNSVGAQHGGHDQGVDMSHAKPMTPNSGVGIKTDQKGPASKDTNTPPPKRVDPEHAAIVEGTMAVGAVAGGYVGWKWKGPEGMVAGAIVGLLIGYFVGQALAKHHDGGGSMPAPDDPGGGGGVGGPRAATEMPAPDSPDGLGVGGPRGRLRRADLYFPNPEGTAGGGPRSRTYFPNPEDGVGPIGPRT